MLKEKDIDSLYDDIQHKGYGEIYRIAHISEFKDGYNDFRYKTHPVYRVTKSIIKSVENAYFEYLNYKNSPELYVSVSEEFYDKNGNKFVNYYMTQKPKQQYTKEHNPKSPAIIYGKRRLFYENDILKVEAMDPSIVKPIYTNALSYLDLDRDQVLSKFEAGELNWKYQKLEEPLQVDTITYKYVTSDWYLLKSDDDLIEHKIVNVKEKSEFFTSLWEAQSYTEQIV